MIDKDICPVGTKLNATEKGKVWITSQGFTKYNDWVLKEFLPCHAVLYNSIQMRCIFCEFKNLKNYFEEANVKSCPTVQNESSPLIEMGKRYKDINNNEWRILCVDAATGRGNKYPVIAHKIDTLYFHFLTNDGRITSDGDIYLTEIKPTVEFYYRLMPGGIFHSINKDDLNKNIKNLIKVTADHEGKLVGVEMVKNIQVKLN